MGLCFQEHSVEDVRVRAIERLSPLRQHDAVNSVCFVALGYGANVPSDCEKASSLELTSVKLEMLINLGRGRLNNDVQRIRARVKLTQWPSKHRILIMVSKH